MIELHQDKEDPSLNISIVREVTDNDELVVVSHAPVIIITHNEELVDMSHAPVVTMTHYDELI